MNMRSLFKGLVSGAFMLCSFSVLAQTPIELHITHRLGGEDFSSTRTVKNNLGNDFRITRLQYYISKISIKHDGGTVTEVPNHYILASESKNVISNLGSYNITNVESVSFHIGVDTPKNHADPAQYPSSHPLSLKNPSMHWGWASGYMFAVIEGEVGKKMDEIFQFHTFGDQNYMETTVQVAGVAKDGKIIIPLAAEYAHVVKDIDLSESKIFHSDTEGDVIQFLNNFKNGVFSSGFPASVGTTADAATAVMAYPNPSFDGNLTVGFDNMPGAASIGVYDIQGREVLSTTKPLNQNTINFKLQTKGLFIMKVQSANGNVAVSKLEVL